MDPWQKQREVIRFNRARPAAPPHWSREVGNVLITCSGTHHFLDLSSRNPAPPLDSKFCLELGGVVRHSDKGKIPTLEQAPVLKALGSTLTFPYEACVETSLADYALTVFCQAAGAAAHLRFRIERMDLATWSILIDDTADLDRPPTRITSNDPGGSIGLFSLDAERFGQAIVAYRQCAYALQLHNQCTAPSDVPAKRNDQPKRFGLLSLFR